MKTTSKVRKKYVLQYCERPSVWVDIDCIYNGVYLADFGGYTGNKSKPTEKVFERIKKQINDFADNNYRVVERTIVLIDSK